MDNITISIEQMRQLKEYGIDTSKASMVLIVTDNDGNELGWNDVEEEFAHPDPIYMNYNYHYADSLYYDHSYREDCGVFTLQDIIELLPKEIKAGTDVFRLTMFVIGEMWTVCYSMSDEFDYYKEFESESLINAAYKMLCWCAENGYLEQQ